MSFSIIDHIAGRTYPEDTVEVFTDINTLYQLVVLNDKANSSFNNEEVARLEADMVPLYKTLKKSALVFHLRGVSMERINAVRDSAKKDESDDDAVAEAVTLGVIALTTQKVVNADGEESAAPSVEVLAQIKAALPESEFNKLAEVVYDLNLKALVFDAKTTPDFLSKS